MTSANSSCVPLYLVICIYIRSVCVWHRLCHLYWLYSHFKGSASISRNIQNFVHSSIASLNPKMPKPMLFPCLMGIRLQVLLRWPFTHQDKCEISNEDAWIQFFYTNVRTQCQHAFSFSHCMRFQKLMKIHLSLVLLVCSCFCREFSYPDVNGVVFRASEHFNRFSKTKILQRRKGAPWVTFARSLAWFGSAQKFSEIPRVHRWIVLLGKIEAHEPMKA